MSNIHAILSQELSVKSWQIDKAVELLDEGATVPFISRYRKEATGGLSDEQLRNLQERLQYLREMTRRREAIIGSIKEQEKLTPELHKKLLAATTKQQLEDLYLPYKPKRQTKAQLAHEMGLTPLADALFSKPFDNPDELAAAYVNPQKNIPDIKAAIEGARYILMERFSEEAELREKLRNHLWARAKLKSTVLKGKEQEGEKFQDYFDFSESINTIPSHRALAIFRGRKASILSIQLVLDEESTPGQFNSAEQMIADYFEIHPDATWLRELVRWSWKIKFLTFLEIELFLRLREQAEEEAFKVFAQNLKSVLLAAPAGQRCTLGLDPGFRTGVKAVVVNSVGKLLEYVTIFPHKPQQRWDDALATLARLCEKHAVELISIGNGTASRETDALVIELCKRYPKLNVTKVMTSEAGASVYSASVLAQQEFPDLDVTYRGAVSIARRLQDPLAELVKIDPKSIGVGQYQHDVSQIKLAKTLDAVVEDCVNAVGVDVNTASAPLLTHISGLNQALAENLVRYREEHGAFASREAIKQVPRMGEKTFEQAAGFLRILSGDNPLDASAVHPESYFIVEEILASLKQPLANIMAKPDEIKKIKLNEFVSDKAGLPTIQDVLKELEKPGRDPRPEFKVAVFNDTVHQMSDLKAGMELEGVVTNVANFGAFVDIGVHQDGLIHISKLSKTFVANPHDVVKTGDVVRVKVEDVDIKRKRISLAMAGSEKPAAPAAKSRAKAQPKAPQSAMAAAFEKLR